MRTVSDLIGRIKAQQAKISDSLTQGFVVNFETYQRLVGQHQGLEEALTIINQLLEEEKKDVE
jgi:hypothetical protein